MSTVLASVAEFRLWAGIGANVADAVLEATLLEAEAGIASDVGESLSTIASNSMARDIAYGECLRRANRLLARKNSPEAVVGVGSELSFTVPTRDPDSQRAVDAIRSFLHTDWAIA